MTPSRRSCLGAFLFQYSTFQLFRFRVLLGFEAYGPYFRVLEIVMVLKIGWLKVTL